MLSSIKEATPLDKLAPEDILELQKLLVTLKYDVGVIDGVYGNNTLYAFRRFKQDYNLTRPDEFGSTTYTYLAQLTSGKTIDKKEVEVPHVKQIILTAAQTIPSTINWDDFKCPISKYFTVGEMLRYDKRRTPQNQNIKANIIKLAHELDKVREEWGSSIGVTSGYRDPATNRRVGGATASQHITGNAADIYPINGKGREFEKWLDQHWYGALGYGQRSGKGFSHLDIRNGKGWKTGGSKGVRWFY